MSDPIVQAAVPSIIAVLQAVKQFNANIGPDPAQWPLKVPGAFTVLLGTIQLQIPGLAVAEGGALQADINSKIDEWTAKLQTPPAA